MCAVLKSSRRTSRSLLQRSGLPGACCNALIPGVATPGLPARGCWLRARRQVRAIPENLGSADAMRAVADSLTADNVAVLSADVVSDVPLAAVLVRPPRFRSPLAIPALPWAPPAARSVQLANVGAVCMIGAMASILAQGNR